MSFKIKPKDPAKYQALSKGELVDTLVRKDNSDLADKWMSVQQEARLLRLGADAGASFITGILYEVRPSLENIMGTPASLDHIAALGGAIGAYVSKDDDVANAFEGIAHSGLSPLLRAAGRKVGAMVPV